MSSPKLMRLPEGPQRFDMFTGERQRRRFTTAEKAAMVAESFRDGNSACGVARRHGLTPQKLSSWGRLARLGSSRSAGRPLFVPVIGSPGLEASAIAEPSTVPKPRNRRRRTERASIELEIDGVMVRVGRNADAGAIAAVIGAQKAGS